MQDYVWRFWIKLNGTVKQRKITQEMEFFYKSPFRERHGSFSLASR